MQRRTLVTVIAMVLSGPMVIVRAQQPSSIDQSAVAALEQMGAYLRSLKAFQVDAVTSTQEVLVNGQKVTFHSETHVLARSPDRLRVSVQGDKRNRLFVYDGKEFTMLARSANYYATTPAPPTVAQLADALEDKLGVEMPLADLFRWGGPQSQTAAITSAMFVGISGVDGISCGHYAFRQPGLDWQIWIQQGDHPLPRRLVLTTMTDEAKPEYTATLDWNLAPSFNEATFTFIPPVGANRVVFAGTSLVNEGGKP